MLESVSILILLVGFVLMFLSYIELGESLRFGTPEEKVKLKTTGIYGISRNPMHVSFYLTYLSSTLYTLNPLVFVTGSVAALVHHKITLAEEDFLRKTFKKEYKEYCQKVPRYI